MPEEPLHYTNTSSGAEKSRKHKEADRILGDFQNQLDDISERVSQLEADEGTIVTPATVTSIDIDYDPVNISNSAVATTVFSGTVPSAYQVVKVEIPFKMVNNTGGTRTLRATVRINGNTVFNEVSAALGASASPRTGLYILYLRRVSNTTQWVSAGVEISATSAAGTWSDPTAGDSKRGYDAGAIDMSAASTLEITFLLSATASVSWNLDTFGAHAEVKVAA